MKSLEPGLKIASFLFCHFPPFSFPLTTGVSNNSLCLLLAQFQCPFPSLSFSLSLTFLYWGASVTQCVQRPRQCPRAIIKYEISHQWLRRAHLVFLPNRCRHII